MNDRMQQKIADGLGRVALLAVAALLFDPAGLATAQTGDRAAVGEYQVKAAFLYHFAKFVEWPSPARNANTLRVCVLGNDPFGPALDLLFEEKTLEGKRFEVRRFGKASDAQSCHLLFVSISDKGALQRAFETLAGSAVLTVGDTDEFIAEGGMVYLFVEDSKIRFDINLAAARQSRLSVSAALLRLARKVEGR